jgi:hypothetical protein
MGVVSRPAASVLHGVEHSLAYLRTPGFSRRLNKGARMKTIIAALCVLAIGTGANSGSAVALEGPGRALRASETPLQISNDPVLTGAAGDSVQRSFIPPYSGTVRVRWEFRSGDGTDVFSGVEVTHVSNCDRSTVSTAFVGKACNVRVVGGMPVTIFAAPKVGTNVVELRNVRLYYRVVDSTGEAITYEVPQM